MQYEPIKRSLGKFFAGSLFMRRLLYFLLDLLLLRAWHIRKALRNISTELPAKAAILDAGSGLGQYSWRMCRKHREWTITGIDIDKEQVDQCNLFFSKAGMAQRASFGTADLTEYIKPGLFNFILSVDVMEHIKEDEKVFRNFNESLRDKGILLISTPSDLGGSDTHKEEDDSFIDEHVRNGYSISDISAKLERAGFCMIQAHYTYGRAGNLSWRLSMKYPVKMLNASYFFFIILPFYFLLTFPVSMILNLADICSEHKSGSGLLVTARKR